MLASPMQDSGSDRGRLQPSNECTCASPEQQEQGASRLPTPPATQEPLLTATSTAAAAANELGEL
jgi:hypothetical protein